MGATCSSETSVGFQRTTWRYIPEYRILQPTSLIVATTSKHVWMWRGTRYASHNHLQWTAENKIHARGNNLSGLTFSSSKYPVVCNEAQANQTLLSDRPQNYVTSLSLLPLLTLLLFPLWSTGHPWNALFHFNFSIIRQSVGFHGRGISPSQGRYLHKHRLNVDIHPCLEWDSNRRSQCSSKRRQFKPRTARSLCSATSGLYRGSISSMVRDLSPPMRPERFRGHPIPCSKGSGGLRACYKALALSAVELYLHSSIRFRQR
jgi:hypothetical protein